MIDFKTWQNIINIEKLIEFGLQHDNFIYLENDIGENIAYVTDYDVNRKVWRGIGALISNQIISQIQKQVKYRLLVTM